MQKAAEVPIVPPVTSPAAPHDDETSLEDLLGLNDPVPGPPPPLPEPAKTLYVNERRPNETTLAFLIRTRGRFYSEQLEGVDDSRSDMRILVPRMALKDDMVPYQPFFGGVDSVQGSDVAVDILIRVSRSDADRISEDMARDGVIDPNGDVKGRPGWMISDDLREYLARCGMPHLRKP